MELSAKYQPKFGIVYTFLFDEDWNANLLKSAQAKSKYLSKSIFIHSFIKLCIILKELGMSFQLTHKVNWNLLWNFSC